MHSVAACVRRPQFESLSALQSFSYSQVDPCSFSQVELPFSQSTANMHTARTRGDSYNSHSLRRNVTAPPGHVQARRKVVNTAVQDYLKSLNSIARSIVLEKETVEKEHNFDWSLMNDSSRDEVVNEHFVPTEVRSQYDGGFIGEWDRSTVTVYHSGDSRQMHMSQPNEWEEAECDELVLRDQYLASHDGTEELSFSQAGYTPQDIGFPATNIHVQSTTKLHKRQLSFNRQNVIRPAVHCSSTNRDSLGSDGESPRTSDEDSGNPLAFQRSRLRSYSMRPKRGSARHSNTAARSSLRSNHRIRPATPDKTEDHSRPSHYNISSTNYKNAEPDYDGEIDLPDEELLLDHVQIPDDESTPVHTPVKPPRYSRAKRSPRGPPKLLIEQADSEIRVSHPPSSIDTESIGSLTVPVFSSNDSIRSTEEMISDSLPLTRTWSPSLSSLLDSISIAPSSTQAADDEDDAMSEQSRMTPDSMLSCSSFSYRPRSKAAEMAVMRNPRGKRGGSCYKTTTSEFADRHAQFKPNMLRKQKMDSAQNLACMSREPTPTPSIAQEDSLSQSGLLKPSYLTLPNPFSKHNSMTESITTDLPNSPDHLSTVSSLSPPSTPLVQKGHLMQSDDSKRESGYISSSSESFAIKR